MKKLFAIWALVALLSPMFVSATTVNIASDGTMWIEKPVTKIELQFGPGVLEHGDAWKQAYAKRGTTVPIKSHLVVKREGLFHVVKTEVADIGIVYDDKSISVAHDVALRSEASFNPFAILWVLSVVVVVFGVLRVRKNEGGVFAVTFALAVVLAASAASAIASIVAVVALAITGFTFNKEIFYVFIGIYGVTMTVGMIAFLSS